MAAPCVHFTSSAKISSCGFVLTCASSDRSSALFVCLAFGLLRLRPDDDLAVEDGPGMTRQDALVDLVARAMRLRVVDRRVRVDEAMAGGDVEAVERALGALAASTAVMSLRRDAGAERQRARRERAGAAQLHAARLATWNAADDSRWSLTWSTTAPGPSDDVRDGGRERRRRRRGPRSPRRCGTGHARRRDAGRGEHEIDGCSRSPSRAQRTCSGTSTHGVRASMTTTISSKNAALRSAKAAVGVCSGLSRVVT